MRVFDPTLSAQTYTLADGTLSIRVGNDYDLDSPGPAVRAVLSIRRDLSGDQQRYVSGSPMIVRSDPSPLRTFYWDPADWSKPWIEVQSLERSFENLAALARALPGHVEVAPVECPP